MCGSRACNGLIGQTRRARPSTLHARTSPPAALGLLPPGLAGLRARYGSLADPLGVGLGSQKSIPLSTSTSLALPLFVFGAVLWPEIVGRGRAFESVR